MTDKDKFLQEFRDRIDRIDDRILDLLAERSEIVQEVGSLKNLAKSKKSIIRPGREATMIRRIAAKSGGAFPRAAVAQMWRLIISSAINIEEKSHISTHSLPGNRECYWLTREYFGSFTPTVEHPTKMEVVQDVTSGNATVGVLPIQDGNARHPWWSRITEGKDSPKIFAKIPFIQMAESEKTSLVAIGYVTPEGTGKDESFWVIKAAASISLSSLEQLLVYEKIDYSIEDSIHTLGNPNMHHYLLKINGFLNEENESINAFLKHANSRLNHDDTTGSNISASFLGAYAVPILFEGK